MHSTGLIRIAIGTAAVIVLVAVWILFRSGAQTEDADGWVRHTQEVLAQIENALAMVADADAAVRQLPVAVGGQNPDALSRADGGIRAEVDRLAALTTDNPTQQSRLQQFRIGSSQVLAALNRVADAKRRGFSNNDHLDIERAALEAVRKTAREMRQEETRLLGERVDRNHAAMRRLQVATATILVAAIGVLVAFLVLLNRTFRHQEGRAIELRQTNTDLEAQVADRTSALRNAAARLQSIIDSTVDGIIVIDTRGNIEAFNRGAERLFGYPATEAIGRNVSMLMPSPQHEEHDSYLQRYLQGGEAKIIGVGREVRGEQVQQKAAHFKQKPRAGALPIKPECGNFPSRREKARPAHSRR